MKFLNYLWLEIDQYMYEAKSLKFKTLVFIMFLSLVGFNYDVTFAESLNNRSNFLHNLKACLKKDAIDECQKMIYQIERMQINEFHKLNFKCQSSLLGAQTELIKKIYFGKNIKVMDLISEPYLIKNC